MHDIFLREIMRKNIAFSYRNIVFFKEKIITEQVNMEAANISETFEQKAANPNPDFAEMSARLEQGLTDAKCDIRLLDSIRNGAVADFAAFTYMPGTGKPTFANSIGLNGNKPESERCISTWHEGIHAIHTAKVPAAHCSPYNMGNMNIILSPTSFIQYVNLTERAAMAGTAMMGYLEGSEEMKEKLTSEPATFEDFKAAMESNGHDLSLALNRVARECLNKNSNYYMRAWGVREKDEPLTLYNYYIWQALKEYHDANRFKFGDQMEDLPKPIFVRMSDEDIMEIGNILGINAFGEGYPDSFFSAKPELMVKHASWLQGLNIMHGVASESSLPTIRQALDKYYDMTPEQFIAHSMNYKHGDATPKLKTEVHSNIIFFPENSGP